MRLSSDLPLFSGAGLGLRQEYLQTLSDTPCPAIDFFEVAPENWLNRGGYKRKLFESICQQAPLICHGLSLSLGSPAPLDWDLLNQIKTFLQRYQVACYSEHLSYCSDDGHLYELMPIPFTEEAVHYVSNRIRQAQDFLQRRIAIENVSYYCAPNARLSEIDFINAVLAEADCDLLLDVNNIYVNSINHRYDAQAFLQALQPRRVAYIHIAGHYTKSKDLLIDTHANSICEPVWQLLAAAYARFGVLPTLLERDNNMPVLAELLDELTRIKQLQKVKQACPS